MGGKLSRPPLNEVCRLSLAVLVGYVIRTLLSRIASRRKRNMICTSTTSAPTQNMTIPARPSRPPPAPSDLPMRPDRPVPRTTATSPSKVVAKRGPPLDVDLWICLDFEWTCDEGEVRAFSSEDAEITEFSYVVFEAKAATVVAEGQYYVKNERTPITDFCTELTGISDETLANAGSLADALRKFEEAMSDPQLRGRSSCAVAHGSADLEITLPRHCKACGISMPKSLRKYVDLREAAQLHVANAGTGVKVSSLKEICTALGVQMLGNEHCGLDDAWMVLLALQQLLKANADLSAIDLDAEMQSFFSNGSEQELCLDGLPYFAIAPEVRRWIIEKTGSPFPESGLTLICGFDGRPSGRAIANFGSFEAASQAFKALENGRAIVTGKWDGAPYGPKERMILARPMRRHERDLIGQSIVPFPAGPQALNTFRKGSGKGKGICYQGRNCVRFGCRFVHPDGRALDEEMNKGSSATH